MLWSRRHQVGPDGAKAIYYVDTGLTDLSPYPSDPTRTEYKNLDRQIWPIADVRAHIGLSSHRPRTDPHWTVLPAAAFRQRSGVFAIKFDSRESSLPDSNLLAVFAALWCTSAFSKEFLHSEDGLFCDDMPTAECFHHNPLCRTHTESAANTYRGCALRRRRRRQRRRPMRLGSGAGCELGGAGGTSVTSGPASRCRSAGGGLARALSHSLPLYELCLFIMTLCTKSLAPLSSLTMLSFPSTAISQTFDGKAKAHQTPSLPNAITATRHHFPSIAITIPKPKVRFAYSSSSNRNRSHLAHRPRRGESDRTPQVRAHRLPPGRHQATAREQRTCLSSPCCAAAITAESQVRGGRWRPEPLQAPPPTPWCVVRAQVWDTS